MLVDRLLHVSILPEPMANMAALSGHRCIGPPSSAHDRYAD